MIVRPSWVDFGDADRRVLQFLWDDARVYRDFTGDASSILDIATKLSIRARLVLLVGLYEWIVWRFDGLHRCEEPVQILEAAWCGTVDPRYLGFFELTREAWVGPVEGPLWCAFTYLEKGFRQSHVFHADTYEAIEFVYLLGLHVLPDTAPFQRWLDATLDRFVQLYPLLPDDPFADLFEERIGEYLGQFIGRDALNPALPIDMGRDRAFLAKSLADARASENPFLASEDDLDDLGFSGVPYVLPEFHQP
jgi:hypothetical protein